MKTIKKKKAVRRVGLVELLHGRIAGLEAQYELAQSENERLQKVMAEEATRNAKKDYEWNQCVDSLNWRIGRQADEILELRGRLEARRAWWVSVLNWWDKVLAGMRGML
jgi:hypothetical protein